MALIKKDKIKNEDNKKKKEVKNLYKDERIRNTLALLPFANFNEEYGYFENKDGSIMDMLMITTRDLNRYGDDSVNRDILRWHNFFSSYADDIKIISTFFLVDTTRQREYYQKILAKTKNPVYKKLINDEINTCEFIGKNFLNKEFILYFYAKNFREYVDKKMQIMALLREDGGQVYEMSGDVKKEHIMLLNNKNMII